MANESRTQRAVREATEIEGRIQDENDKLVEQARAEREIKQAPVPTKRHQPKIKRHQSREGQIVQGQTKNPIRAIYGTESRWNATPLLPEDATTTREVGPGDQYNQKYRAGTPTTEYVEGNKRDRPYSRTAGGGSNRRPKPGKTDFDSMADQLLATYWTDGK